jgi:HEAT repeat protein
MRFLSGSPNIERLKEKRDIRRLAMALRQEKDKAVRSKAAEALGEIGDSSAVDPLCHALREADSLMDWELGITVVKALSRFADQRATEALVRALTGQSALVCREAAIALGTTPQGTAMLANDSRIRLKHVEALGRCGDEVSLDVLVRSLADKDREIRKLAAETLVVLGKVDCLIDRFRELPTDVQLRIVSLLIRAFADPKREIRKKAAETIAAIGDPAADLLMRALKRRSEDVREVLKRRSEDVREWSAWSLGHMRSPRAVGLLVEAMRDGNEDVRKQAALALGETKDPKAIPDLVRGLGDTAWIVRDASASALDALGSAPREAAESDARETIGKVRSLIDKTGRPAEDCEGALRSEDGDIAKAAERLARHKELVGRPREVAFVLILKRGDKPENDNWYVRQVVETLVPEALGTPGVKVRARWGLCSADFGVAAFAAMDEFGADVLDNAKFETYTQEFHDANGGDGILFVARRR